MSFTLPARLSRRAASTSATPIRIAVCASWPQACITSTSRPLYCARTFEAKGTSASSFTGNASMSARSATTGDADRPRSRPTTPVCATPVVDLDPERAQVVRHQGRRAQLPVPELRVLVDVPPPGDHLRLDLLRQAVDLLRFRRSTGEPPMPADAASTTNDGASSQIRRQGHPCRCSICPFPPEHRGSLDRE